MWTTMFSRAVAGERGGEAAGGVIVQSARQAVVYLLRLEEWDQAQQLLEQAVLRDPTPAGRTEAARLLRHIAVQAAGTDAELPALGVLAEALAATDPDEAEQLMHRVEAEAAASGRHQVAGVAAGNLANLLQRRGRTSHALDVVDRKVGHTRRAGLGPWTQLGDQCRRLQLLLLLGELEQVLAEVAQLIEDMAELPDPRARTRRSGPGTSAKPCSTPPTPQPKNSVAGTRPWPGTTGRS